MIKEWFKNQNYYEGVKIYKELGKTNRRILAALERGKSTRNMSLLIRELRKHKNTKPTIRKVTKPIQKKQPVEKTMARDQQKTESAKSYFQKVNYSELHPELKKQYRHLKDIFYDMCDLKFVLNDLPDEEEETANELIKKLFFLDKARSQIWKEIDHWMIHKTLLPRKTEDDFSKMDTKALLLKKASIRSSLTKMKKRVEVWTEELGKINGKSKRLKMNEKLNRTKKRMHLHELNLQKIEGLL